MQTGDAASSALWQAIRSAVDGTTRQRGAPASSPVGRYLDADRHRREVAALRRHPHAVGPLARLAANGDWLTAEPLGVPVLVVRGGDGVLRAFVNVCRHRGARVAPPSQCGSDRRRFVCPYHSWTYDDRGALVGRPHEADFAPWPRDGIALMPLAVAERCGLAWVVPDATFAAFAWPDYFGPLAQEIEQLGYDAESRSPHARSFEQPSNWKLVLDANLESYHFQYAHRETIAPMFHDNVVVHESFGRHQRIVLPKRSFADADAELGDRPASWDLLGRHANIIYFFFPATFLLWEGDHIDAFAIAPMTPGRTAATGWMLVPSQHHALRDAAHWQRNWQIFWNAIDEDFALAASMQVGLASGANATLSFGAAEFACERFEKDVEAMLDEAADDVTMRVVGGQG